MAKGRADKVVKWCEIMGVVLLIGKHQQLPIKIHLKINIWLNNANNSKKKNKITMLL